MTPFHLKLYYLLTEKNTGAGQSNSMQYGYGQHHHHHHYGSKAKQKQAQNIQNIDQVNMPKKLLVITNQQEVKESRQMEAKKLNVSLIGKKKKKAMEQSQVGQDETQQACTSLLDYCAEIACQKVKDKRVVVAPNTQVEQVNGLKYKVRPVMDWDYLIKIARDENPNASHLKGNSATSMK